MRSSTNACSGWSIDKPVIVDLDIIRAAKVAIKAYGETASLHAAIRAERVLVEGDMEGFWKWRRVEEAIDQTQQASPEGQGAVR